MNITPQQRALADAIVNAGRDVPNLDSTISYLLEALASLIEDTSIDKAMEWLRDRNHDQELGKALHDWIQSRDDSKTLTQGDAIPSRLVSLLKSLDAAIPEGEGTVSLRLFSDGSGRFDLEMWGAPVASGPLGEEMVTDRGLVIGANPDWLPDVEDLVARLNSILPNA